MAQDVQAWAAVQMLAIAVITAIVVVAVDVLVAQVAAAVAVVEEGINDY